MEDRIKIALTMGCPAGVGPELVVATADKLQDKFDVIVYGNPDILEKASKLKAVPIPQRLVETPPSSFDALEMATQDVIAGRAHVLVTAPINKSSWHDAGVKFVGHTEYLADKCRSKKYAMMMAGPKLKVTIATIHIAVKDISTSLTTEKITTAILLTHDALQNYFGINEPRIAVAGLNPHCGENGLMGNEEFDIIKPAIETAQARGIAVAGPLPGDTIFVKCLENSYDAAIAMYHDQGLSAVKTFDNKHTVNITLGLPIIRTSVDHGTAMDIAWKGIADDTNMTMAVTMAADMYKKRSKI